MCFGPGHDEGGNNEAARRQLQNQLEELTGVAAERLRCDAVKRRTAARLAALAEEREAGKRVAESAAASATAAALQLPRAQLEELRALRGPRGVPARAVRESLALVYALLRPSELLDSVEHARWETVAELLRYDELLQQIREFPDPDSAAGLLLAVPVVRYMLDDVLASRSTVSSAPSSIGGCNAAGRCDRMGDAGSKPTLRSARKTSMTNDRQRSCASGMAAQLLAGTPRTGRTGSRGGDVAPRLSSIVCGSDDHDIPNTDSFGLVSILSGECGLTIVDVASMSPPVGVLLNWAVCQLRRLKIFLPSRSEGMNAASQEEQTLNRDGKEAERSLAKLASKEAELVQQVLRAHTEFAELQAADTLRWPSAPPSCLAKLLAESTVQFTKGSALMSSLAVRSLSGITEALRNAPRLELVIEGCGSSDESKELLLKRAATVKKYLVSQGLAAHRFCTLSFSTANSQGQAWESSSPWIVRFSEVPRPILPEDAICFAACSDAMPASGSELLDAVGAQLLEVPCLVLEIEGHTDDAPMWLGNMALSEGRAERIASYLHQFGVPRAQLEAIGRAERAPRVANKTSEGRSANRRVELRVAVTETAAQMRALRWSEDLPAERMRTLLWQLALVAAGLAGQPRLDNCPAELQTGLLGEALRRVAGEVMGSWGIEWGSQLAHDTR